ncbi:Calx-beta domain-containing protein [Aliarcobacter cryaerophilus]|uniref:Calx-beta domain-containing protein n=1 Tax=Aliarcobacter cryaerophilus TaxID=28198 RepID=A0A2S9TGJ7_9BACT|nr:Calx-beta domain-containing protein [Aliarcobacter cryaerophilus]PRM97927.1 hypothetical protein CJ670_04465 [Arcobacter cryaerophilus gv. crypticus]
MSAKVGIVQEINDGNFFVKDSSGNTKELKNGDIIYENDVVFSDGSNSNLAQIKIALEGEDIIVLKNGVQQLFDSSLIASTFGNEEMVFAKESLDAMLDSHSDMTNVWSNLNEEGFSDYQDITEEETTAGEEEEEVLEEGSIGQFALRDGALVDVISDLRKKSWVRTQDYREVENSEALEEASLKPLGGIDSITTVTPPSTIPVTPPPVTPPTVTPPPPTPVPIANLSIDDITMYEQDGYMVFTVTLDRPANGNISVNFATSNGTAESGKDYTPTTGVITIPSGSSTAQIRVPINDDYYYENSEQFKVTLTNPTGNVNMVKPVGIGTILDNPPTTEKTPTTNNTPDSGTGTYDSGDTVYVKLVNSATVKEGIDVNDDLKKSTLKHYIQLVDKNGNPVVIPTGKSITVELEYKNILGTVTKNDFQDGDFQEGVDLKNKVTITLDSNSPKDANGVYIVDIKNPAIYDGDDEGLEIYELTIGKITQNGNPFENVTKHPTENTVTGAIYDTVPDNAKIETTEDKSKDLTISSNIKDMFVDNGKGFVKVPPNGQVILYDKDKPIGTITYDQSGNKFTFTPNEDYSNYKNADDIKFLYYAVNNDDSREFKNVTVEVTPVADAPTITVNNVTTYEDNKNTQEGQHKIALGLIVPSLSKDLTDKNGGAGDHPERNGEITLKFTNGSSVTGAKLFNGNSKVANISSNNQEIKVVIVTQSETKDVDYTYHHKDITASNPSGTVLYLTKDEYKNLKIQHAEDNDTDIKINIGVTSYELDDDGKPLNALDSTYPDRTNTDLSKTTNAEMKVVILPVTDDISIKWDSTSKGTYTEDGKTYTFNPMNKAETNELYIDDIMSATSGALHGTGGTKGDLDGSEKRTYIVEGLPTGTIVTIGGQPVTVGADGKATITFSDANNKELDHSDFKIELPKYYAGTVNGTIILQVKDEGVTGESQQDTTDYGVKDSSGNPLLGVKEDSVNFEINVMPVVISDPSNETIQIAQAIGNEDAGRGSKDGETNNVHNKEGNEVSSSGNITNPENGLKLNIEPKGSKLGAKGETATIWIDKVPVGGSMYIYDNSTKAYKLIGVEGGKVYEYTKDSNNEYTEKTELIGGKSDNISVTLNSDNTYKVEIKDYQNLKSPDIELPTFIPPHNDDKDYIFKISGEKVSSAVIDGQTVVSTKPYNSGSTLDMSVIVKNIADEPINTELVDGDKIVNISGTNYIKATEDIEFKLADIYKNGTPSSFDDVGAEVLSIKITLPDGVTILNGTKYHIDGKDYVIKSSELKDIQLVFDKNFSGTTGEIKLKYITTETEKENSSKTHFEQTVKLFVTPVVDGELQNKSEATEEIGVNYIDANAGKSFYKLDLGIINNDGDNDEYIDSIKFSVPTNGYELYIKNDDTFTKIVSTNNSIYKANLGNIYVQVNEHFSGDVSVGIEEYTIKDKTTNDTSGEVSKPAENYIHTLTINPVTDKPDITVNDTTTTTSEKVTVDNSDKTKITISQNSAEFTVQVKTTSKNYK